MKAPCGAFTNSSALASAGFFQSGDCCGLLMRWMDGLLFECNDGTTEWTRIVVDGEEVDATWRMVNGAALVQVRRHRTKRVSKRVCSPTELGDAKQVAFRCAAPASL